MLRQPSARVGSARASTTLTPTEFGAVRYVAILGETNVSKGLPGPFAKDGKAGDDAEDVSRSASFIGDDCISLKDSKAKLWRFRCTSAPVAC